MLIHELTLRGILSFGPDTPPLEMRPLNVLIGPNGSGKSNLIECLGLLKAAPKDLDPVIANGGGPHEWVWKGQLGSEPEVAARVATGEARAHAFHRMHLTPARAGFCVEAEQVRLFEGNGECTLFDLDSDGIVPLLQDRQSGEMVPEDLDADLFGPYKSVLARLGAQHPVELRSLARRYGSMRLYREWPFGRKSALRSAQSAALPRHPLEEDLSNLGLFLNHLRTTPTAKRQIVERLRDLYEGLDDFDVRVIGNTVEIFLTEGDHIIPAIRLSDGTLRYLCLLAILCDPEPPPLICIEEPELGLHPDLMPKLADLLVEASERTQLVVTTHSDVLVDAMTEHPESVVVFEKHDGKTVMERLSKDDLAVWLKDYRLGQLWSSGHIGGNRW